MNPEFITFKTFPDKVTADSVAEILHGKGIRLRIEEDALVFDPSYANNPLNKEYLLKLAPADFSLATQALESYFSTQLDQVDESYYLYSFTDEELMEIVAKPDEWGSFDYLLAQQLLQQRGIALTEEEKETLKEKRLQDLRRPERETVSNIFGYYLVSILFFPVGLVIGWVWGYSKKNLPNGERVYAYDQGVQRHGRTIFTLAVALFLLTVLFKFAGTLPGR